MRKVIRWFRVMCVAVTLAFPSIADAQTCFRGRPLPACRDFTILEFAPSYRLSEKEGQTDSVRAVLSWNVGYMRNIRPATALGAGVKITADSDGHRYGPILRLRHWMGNSRTSADVTAGMFVAGEDNFAVLGLPSVTADVALNYRDLIAISAGVDALRRTGSGTSWEPYLGLRFGTWLAPIATLALGIAAAATW
jgi:hypothetical protein